MNTLKTTVQRAQRRIVIVLALATILGGLGVGASFSVGSLLIVDVTGNTALGGLGATMNAVGAAVAGMPLARFAARRGRRVALASGNLIAVLGAVTIVAAAITEISWLLIVGFGVLGVASAVQLQSRFAAADLALPERRARDLSLVVWSITIGAVTGPNLIGPGERVGAALGLPELTGVFVFTIGAQLLSAIVVWLFLRPDPLLEARRLTELEDQALLARSVSVAAASQRVDASEKDLTASAAQASDQQSPPSPASPTRVEHTAKPGNKTGILSIGSQQFYVIALIALGHAVMVGLMAMTPLHIVAHGEGVAVVGLTISLHIAGMYALSPVAGYATGRFGALPVIFVGFGILLLSALGTGFGGDSMFVIQIALVLLGLGWSAVTVAGAALLTEITPLQERPKRQGQSDTTMNATGALFGAVSGPIFGLGGFPILSIVAGIGILGGVYSAIRLAQNARARSRVIERSSN